MTKPESEWKSNLITALIIFTFFIPVIPIGAYYAWNAAFGSRSDRVINQSDSTNAPPEETNNSTEYIKPSYNGYTCSDDCSGHEAGYEWAEENDVCDEYFDGGNSDSFNEGVISYSEENCSSYEESDDNDYDYYDNY